MGFVKNNYTIYFAKYKLNLRSRVEPRPIENADHRLEYERRRHELIDKAKQGRNEAVSHRDFHVGAAVMGYKKESGEYVIESGGNKTPKANANARAEEKRCAERNALDKALEQGADYVASITTISKELTTDPEKSPEHDALHPCPDCRALLRELMALGVVDENTVIENINDEPIEDADIEMIGEMRSIGELMELYRDDVAA